VLRHFNEKTRTFEISAEGKTRTFEFLDKTSHLYAISKSDQSIWMLRSYLEKISTLKFDEIEKISTLKFFQGMTTHLYEISRADDSCSPIGWGTSCTGDNR